MRIPTFVKASILPLRASLEHSAKHMFADGVLSLIPLLSFQSYAQLSACHHDATLKPAADCTPRAQRSIGD